MIKSDNPNEEIVATTFIGEFLTANGAYKVFAVTIKQKRES